MTLLANRTEKFKEILLANGVAGDVESVQVELVDTDGNHFSSICESVTVTLKGGESLNFFIKRQFETENEREKLEEVQVYEKEHCFFSSLLPDLVRFAQLTPTYDGFIEKIVPKCFYSDEDLLVLEHLKFSGYAMLRGNVCHDWEHAELALDRLARFHASTYALLQSLGQDAFEAKYPFIHYMNSWSKDGEKTRGPWLQMVIDGALKILRAKQVPGSEQALQYFQGYETNGFLKLTRHYDLEESPSCALVVNHGDFWKANMMFKNDDPEGNSAPSDCIVIDWQTFHLGSPALDLQFYLFLVLDKSVRQKGWTDIVKFYYEKFQFYANNLGQATLFSLEELVTDFRKKFETGFIMNMYNVFGIAALKHPTDPSAAPPTADDNILHYLRRAMNNGLDHLMDQRGEEFSRGIVEAFEEFQKVRSLSSS